MANWTHLIRFIALEDGHIHLGQLVDTSRDIGLDSLNGKEISAYLIDGSIFDGRVTNRVFNVKQVSVNLSKLLRRKSSLTVNFVSFFRFFVYKKGPD